jgi:hypothetical protein
VLGLPGVFARRRARAAALAIALLLVPATVLAVVQPFADVPPSNPFFTDISNVYNARIAAGCGGGNYCPSTPVTREQMAAFLDRSGGRIGYSGYSAASAPLSGTSEVVATVTIKPGNVSGGTAFVHLQASAVVYTNSATGLPTYGVFYIREQGIDNPIGGAYGYAQVDALASGSYGAGQASINSVVSAPTGVTKTYELVGYIAYGTGTLNAKGSLTAEYFPFSENGDNVLSAPAAASGVTKSPLNGK